MMNHASASRSSNRKRSHKFRSTVQQQHSPSPYSSRIHHGHEDMTVGEMNERRTNRERLLDNNILDVTGIDVIDAGGAQALSSQNRTAHGSQPERDHPGVLTPRDDKGSGGYSESDSAKISGAGSVEMRPLLLVDLPDDCLYEIFGYAATSIQDVLNLMSVNRDLHRVGVEWFANEVVRNVVPYGQKQANTSKDASPRDSHATTPRSNHCRQLSQESAFNFQLELETPEPPIHQSEEAAAVEQEEFLVPSYNSTTNMSEALTESRNTNLPLDVMRRLDLRDSKLEHMTEAQLKFLISKMEDQKRGRINKTRRALFNSRANSYSARVLKDRQQVFRNIFGTPVSLHRYGDDRLKSPKNWPDSQVSGSGENLECSSMGSDANDRYVNSVSTKLSPRSSASATSSPRERVAMDIVIPRQVGEYLIAEVDARVLFNSDGSEDKYCRTSNRGNNTFSMNLKRYVVRDIIDAGYNAVEATRWRLLRNVWQYNDNREETKPRSASFGRDAMNSADIPNDPDSLGPLHTAAVSSMSGGQAQVSPVPHHFDSHSSFDSLVAPSDTEFLPSMFDDFDSDLRGPGGQIQNGRVVDDYTTGDKRWKYRRNGAHLTQSGRRDDIQVKFVKRGFVQSESLTLQDKIEKIEKEQRFEKNARQFMTLENKLRGLRWELRALEYGSTAAGVLGSPVASTSAGSSEGFPMQHGRDSSFGSGSGYEIDPDSGEHSRRIGVATVAEASDFTAGARRLESSPDSTPQSSPGVGYRTIVGSDALRRPNITANASSSSNNNIGVRMSPRNSLANIEPLVPVVEIACDEKALVRSVRRELDLRLSNNDGLSYGPLSEIENDDTCEGREWQREVLILERWKSYEPDAVITTDESGMFTTSFREGVVKWNREETEEVWETRSPLRPESFNSPLLQVKLAGSFTLQVEEMDDVIHNGTALTSRDSWGLKESNFLQKQLHPSTSLPGAILTTPSTSYHALQELSNSSCQSRKNNTAADKMQRNKQQQAVESVQQSASQNGTEVLNLHFDSCPSVDESILDYKLSDNAQMIHSIFERQDLAEVIHGNPFLLHALPRLKNMVARVPSFFKRKSPKEYWTPFQAELEHREVSAREEADSSHDAPVMCCTQCKCPVMARYDVLSSAYRMVNGNAFLVKKMYNVKVRKTVETGYYTTGVYLTRAVHCFECNNVLGIKYVTCSSVDNTMKLDKYLIAAKCVEVSDCCNFWHSRQNLVRFWRRKRKEILDGNASDFEDTSSPDGSCAVVDADANLPHGQDGNSILQRLAQNPDTDSQSGDSISPDNNYACGPSENTTSPWRLMQYMAKSPPMSPHPQENADHIIGRMWCDVDRERVSQMNLCPNCCSRWCFDATLTIIGMTKGLQYSSVRWLSSLLNVVEMCENSTDAYWWHQVFSQRGGPGTTLAELSRGCGRASVLVGRCFGMNAEHRTTEDVNLPSSKYANPVSPLAEELFNIQRGSSNSLSADTNRMSIGSSENNRTDLCTDWNFKRMDMLPKEAAGKASTCASNAATIPTWAGGGSISHSGNRLTANLPEDVAQWMRNLRISLWESAVGRYLTLLLKPLHEKTLLAEKTRRRRGYSYLKAFESRFMSEVCGVYVDFSRIFHSSLDKGPSRGDGHGDNDNLKRPKGVAFMESFDVLQDEECRHWVCTSSSLENGIGIRDDGTAFLEHVARLFREEAARLLLGESMLYSDEDTLQLRTLSEPTAHSHPSRHSELDQKNAKTSPQPTMWIFRGGPMSRLITGSSKTQQAGSTTIGGSTSSIHGQNPSGRSEKVQDENSRGSFRTSQPPMITDLASTESGRIPRRRTDGTPYWISKNKKSNQGGLSSCLGKLGAGFDSNLDNKLARENGELGKLDIMRRLARGVLSVEFVKEMQLQLLTNQNEGIRRRDEFTSNSGVDMPFLDDWAQLICFFLNNRSSALRRVDPETGQLHKNWRLRLQGQATRILNPTSSEIFMEDTAAIGSWIDHRWGIRQPPEMSFLFGSDSGFNAGRKARQKLRGDFSERRSASLIRKPSKEFFTNGLMNLRNSIFNLMPGRALNAGGTSQQSPLLLGSADFGPMSSGQQVQPRLGPSSQLGVVRSVDPDSSLAAIDPDNNIAMMDVYSEGSAAVETTSSKDHAEQQTEGVAENIDRGCNSNVTYGSSRSEETALCSIWWGVVIPAAVGSANFVLDAHQDETEGRELLKQHLETHL